MKKVFIFHISEIGGHNKAAQNLKEAFLYRNPQIKIMNINGLGYFYPLGEKVINLMYLITIKHFPHLWGKAYDRKRVIKTLSPLLQLINRFTFEKLEHLIQHGNPDCFLATQAFPCGLIGDFKQKYKLKTPLVGIVTDYHPHRFWVHPSVDRYVVACQEAKDALVKEGVSKEKVRVLGIPISVKFLTSYPKAEVAQEMGFVDNQNSLLIMGGGLGMGPLKLIARKLDKLVYDFQLIVICGNNKRLYEWFINNKSTFKKPISIFGYTDDVYKIMDFADIIITKGGGITISEALAKGMCIVVSNPIPGQEERNVDYLLGKQALVDAEDILQINNIINELLSDKKKMYSLKEKAKENAVIDSSLRIVDLVLKLIS